MTRAALKQEAKTTLGKSGKWPVAIVALLVFGVATWIVWAILHAVAGIFYHPAVPMTPSYGAPYGGNSYGNQYGYSYGNSYGNPYGNPYSAPVSVGTLIVQGITGGAISLLVTLLEIIVVGPLMLGLYKQYLAIARNEKITFDNLFSSYLFFYFRETALIIKGWLSYVLPAVYLALWSLLIIPAFIKPFSYAMTWYILNDHPEYTVNQAITESRKMMNGHKFELFILYLSFFWWYLLVAVTFGLASFYVEPYVRTTVANFYRRLSGQDADAVAA